MAALLLRHRRYSARVRVPALAQHLHGGRVHLQKNLDTSDRKVAEVRAAQWEAELRTSWMAAENPHLPEARQRRAVYMAERARAESGAYVATPMPAFPEDFDTPETSGMTFEIERIADALDGRDPSPVEEAKLWALNDARQLAMGQPVPERPELEATFSEVAEDYMKLWATQQGLKDTNTKQQKVATFGLFAGFWRDRPIKGVRPSDAAHFHDELRRLDPVWARSPAGKEMTWSELKAAFGDRPKGLSDATINRHMATLKALWEWAKRRGRCSGDNPFDGFHRKLRTGVNVKGYVAWENEELERLFNPPPKRIDLREIMVVGMFTGMRLDEIASLKWGQLRTADGVTYFDVKDAKTPAGNREVPVHPSLGWLTARRQGKPGERIWATFNPEGPGKKAGADAGREFSRFKASRGFDSRQKAFHSFRKNVTRQMERAGVPENEWALILGHERGITYGRYNPDGITLQRKAEIIGLIGYGDLALPTM